MENASKALIIAGAILISIVLIGVGVLIVGNAQGIFDTGAGQLTEMEINAFNSNFTSYEGKRTGSQVRSLLTKISTHNVNYSEDVGKQVKFNGGIIDTTNVSATKNLVSLGTSYKVELEMDATTGLVTNIKTTPEVKPTAASGSSSAE